MQKPAGKAWIPLMMVLTIMAIAAFQAYWLSQAYQREERVLERETNGLFRETVFQLQSSKLKLDKLPPDSIGNITIRRNGPRENITVMRRSARPNRQVVNMVDLLVRKAKDSSPVVMSGNDTLLAFNRESGRRRNRLMQFLFEVDSLQDSVRIKEINTAYRKKLEEQNIKVPFTVTRIASDSKAEPSFNQVTLGFAHPITYQLTIESKMPYLLRKIAVPILFSLFLVAFTFLSFMLLYRNLLRQRRLSDIKNEFISNITHELKTPIATVSVAIEALRSFGAQANPQRTREYLDISANELQRLSLLVDKVLKLSMFEKKEIEFSYEPLDMKQIVEEVLASMRLQFENKKALVHFSANGDASLQGDKLHLVSVVFNLLDNALKYSKGSPEIDISLQGEERQVVLQVSDKGIGIPAEYHHKVFDKFFRVPHGNVHNAKGYGLGLSYVSHVVENHKGRIEVSSVEGKGSAFKVMLPKG
jgi:two-component system, OmpR family, phosphate regulon sensor histidine kinase PhoR